MQDENDHISTNADASPLPDPEGAGRIQPGHEAERQAQARRERAARTLRDNLLRRKQQGRARRAGAADETSGLPAAKTDESSE